MKLKQIINAPVYGGNKSKQIMELK